MLASHDMIVRAYIAFRGICDIQHENKELSYGNSSLLEFRTWGIFVSNFMF